MTQHWCWWPTCSSNARNDDRGRGMGCQSSSTIAWTITNRVEDITALKVIGVQRWRENDKTTQLSRFARRVGKKYSYRLSCTNSTWKFPNILTEPSSSLKIWYPTTMAHMGREFSTENRNEMQHMSMYQVQVETEEGMKQKSGKEIWEEDTGKSANLWWVDVNWIGTRYPFRLRERFPSYASKESQPLYCTIQLPFHTIDYNQNRYLDSYQ